MKVFIAALAAVAALTMAAPALALTKNQAYAKARTCLISQVGASLVVRRPDGGGVASWNTKLHGSTFWTYKMSGWFRSQVASVTVYFAGVPGLPGTTQTAVKRCLIAGV